MPFNHLGHPATNALNWVWDIGFLEWVEEVQASGGSGGGGGLTNTELRAADVKITLDGETVPVTGTFYQATQPVSGSFYQATQPVSIASMPATPVTDNGGSITVDGTVAVSGTVAVTQSGTWDEIGINDSGNSITVDGTFWQTTQPVSAAALPLPSGAATEAGNLATIAAKDFATQTTLALIKAKTDNLDVALSTRTKPADAQHVIVDSSASIAVTGPLTDTQLRATPVPVSGTVATGGLTDTQLRASAVPVSLTSTTVTGTVAVTQSGTWDEIGINDSGNSITVDGTVAIGAGSAVIGHVIADTGSTTAVTGNVTVVQPTGTSLHTVLDSGTLSTITNVVHVDDNSGSLTVDGPITNTEFRAASLPAATPATTLTASGTISAAAQTLSLALNGRSSIILEVISNSSASNYLAAYSTTGLTSSPAIDMYLMPNFEGTMTASSVLSNTGIYFIQVPPGTDSVTVYGYSWDTGSASLKLYAQTGFAPGLSFMAGIGTSGTGGIIGAATATPSASERGLIVREAARGIGTMATSIPVTIASDQTIVSTAVNQATLNTGLLRSQGATSVSATGPMVQAVASDTSASFGPDTINPLQLSTDGRLRVVTLNESYNFTSWGDIYSYGSDTSGDFPTVHGW